MQTAHKKNYFSPFLREIADLIGDEAARSLADHFGGVRWYIPKTPLPDHKFVQVIGFSAFKKLCEAFCNECIDIPRNEMTKKEKILALTGSAKDVALEVGCSERHVYSVRSRCK